MNLTLKVEDSGGHVTAQSTGTDDVAHEATDKSGRPVAVPGPQPN